MEPFVLRGRSRERRLQNLQSAEQHRVPHLSVVLPELCLLSLQSIAVFFASDCEKCLRVVTLDTDRLNLCRFCKLFWSYGV